MRRAALALGAALLFSPRGARGEAGLSGAAFLQRPLGARAAALGYAFAAVPGGLEGVPYNPAALSSLDARALSSTYLRGFGGTNFGLLGYGQPTRLGAVAAQVLYFNAGPIELNLSDGTTGRVTAEESSAWTLSYACPPWRGLMLGATYRFLRSELAERARASSSQADLGAAWKAPLGKLGLHLGAAWQFIGPNIRYEEVGDPAPSTRRFGVALRLPDLDAAKLDPSVDLAALDLLLAADLVQTLHEKDSLRFGAELGLKPVLMDRFAFRAGWILGRDSEGATLGLGLKHGRVGLDYAFGLAEELGSLQQITLGVKF